MNDNIKQIQHLERQIELMKKRNSFSYALLFTIIFLFCYSVVNMLMAMVLDKVSFSQYLGNFDWVKLLVVGGIWMIVYYAWMVRDNKKRIAAKQAQLDMLKEAQG